MASRPKNDASGPQRLSPEEIDQVVHFLLADVMKEELSKKLSEPDALRKALLTLILLTAEDADEATRQYIDYLLTHFIPVASKFEGHAQVLWRRHTVGRAREPGGTHLRLVAPKELVDELLKDVPGIGGKTS
jgi:hypothetical protein